MVTLFVHLAEPTQLTTENLTTLRKVLVEHLPALKNEGVDFEADHSEITKEKVVSGLRCIGQHDLAEALSKENGKKSMIAVS